MTVRTLIGKKIVAVKARAYRYANTPMKALKRQPKDKTPEFIMFDDGKTFLHFDDQDYHTHHDCDSSAKIVYIHQDKRRWEEIMTSELYINTKARGFEL